MAKYDDLTTAEYANEQRQNAIFGLFDQIASGDLKGPSGVKNVVLEMQKLLNIQGELHDYYEEDEAKILNYISLSNTYFVGRIEHILKEFQLNNEEHFFELGQQRVDLEHACTYIAGQLFAGGTSTRVLESFSTTLTQLFHDGEHINKLLASHLKNQQHDFANGAILLLKFIKKLHINNSVMVDSYKKVVSKTLKDHLTSLLSDSKTDNKTRIAGHIIMQLKSDQFHLILSENYGIYDFDFINTSISEAITECTFSFSQNLGEELKTESSESDKHTEKPDSRSVVEQQARLIDYLAQLLADTLQVDPDELVSHELRDKVNRIIG